MDALQLVSLAFTIADKLNALELGGADEIRETAIHYKSLTLELNAYTNSSRVGRALVDAIERQMERDSELLEKLVNQGIKRLESR